MRIFFLAIAAFMAGATQIPSSFSQGADIFLNCMILIGAGMAAFTAGSLSK